MHKLVQTGSTVCNCFNFITSTATCAGAPPGEHALASPHSHHLPRALQQMVAWLCVHDQGRFDGWQTTPSTVLPPCECTHAAAHCRLRPLQGPCAVANMASLAPLAKVHGCGSNNTRHGCQEPCCTAMMANGRGIRRKPAKKWSLCWCANCTLCESYSMILPTTPCRPVAAASLD